MTYRTVADILAAKEAALQRIVQRVDGLSSAQLQMRSPGDGWCTEEILEHLVKVERGLLRLIKTLLTKAEETPGKFPADSAYEVSVGHILEQSQREKYVTRDTFMPSGAMGASESLQDLRTIQQELLGLRVRLESVDPSLVHFPHWVFGPLNLGQWLAFMVLHEERHLAQMNAIGASS